ncbi:Ig-like domain-containing protein [Terriglobus roseus]|nr:Ig-like domain-containing protein [Terriglobus roseus]
MARQAQTTPTASADAAAAQGQLFVAASRYEVLAGQSIDVTAALNNGATVDRTTAATTLFLDGTAVRTGSIANADTVTFSGINIAAGPHALYVSTAATATMPEVRSADVVVAGVTDPAGNLGVAADPAEKILLQVAPLINVGSQISAQVECRLASGSLINGSLRILDNDRIVVDSQDAGTRVVNATFFAAPGPHIYQCDYTNGIHSSALGAQMVAPVLQPEGLTFEVFSLPDPTKYGDPVTIGGAAAPFSSSMTGRLRITEGTAVVLDQALDATGRATTTNATLSPGIHTFRGEFTITDSTTSIRSGRSFTQTVRGAPTQIRLTANPTSGIVGITPVTLTIATTSSYADTPITGTVQLLRDGKALSVAGVTNGSVLLPPGTLPVGTSLLTAAIHGGSIFGSSTSNAVSIVMTAREPPDFSVTLSTPSLAVARAHHAEVNIMLKSINGFNGTVLLSCSNLPPFATCNFNAARYALSSSAPATLTVETSAAPTYKSSLRPHAGAVLACALPLSLLLLLRGRSAARRCLLLLLTTALALASTACSVAPVPAYTPPGTYAITISATGTSGGTTVTHTIPLRLTITSD